MPAPEIAGLPDGGPATLPGVKARLGIPSTDTASDTVLTSIVAAVNVKVRGLPVCADASGESDWTACEHIVQGATLLAMRLWRRKNSPAGVEVLGDTVAYVMRNDPDVGQYLNLGTWQLPGLG